MVICPVGYDRSEAVKAAADQLHADLLAKGVDVILDDRGERPGAMFADWELIGVPHRVVLGDKGLKEGVAEYQARTDAEATKGARGRSHEPPGKKPCNSLDRHFSDQLRLTG